MYSRNPFFFSKIAIDVIACTCTIVLRCYVVADIFTCTVSDPTEILSVCNSDHGANVLWPKPD